MSEASEIRFAGHGGDELRALLVVPGGGEPARGGVVLIHEVFGLDQHMADVAARLAGAGYAVIAPDLYSRAGLPGPAPTETEPAPVWPVDEIRAAVASLPDRRVLADLEAAIGALVEHSRADGDRIATLGFCMGGCYAFLLGCVSTRIAAVVDFYGRVVYPDLSAEKPTQPLELALNLGAPLLALFGEEDPSIPADHVERMRGVLSQFAKDFDIVTYPGAGHGFVNDLRGGYHAQSANDAWSHALAFLDERLC